MFSLHFVDFAVIHRLKKPLLNDMFHYFFSYLFGNKCAFLMVLSDDAVDLGV